MMYVAGVNHPFDFYWFIWKTHARHVPGLVKGHLVEILKFNVWSLLLATANYQTVPDNCGTECLQYGVLRHGGYTLQDPTQ